jgi:predicted nucleic acid-binding protein
MESLEERGSILSFVLDSSVTVAWLFEEETTPAVRAVFDRLVRSAAWVPSLWRLEVANSLHMATRRGRVTAAFRDESLDDLSLLPINVDPETDRQAWGATVQLAAASGLTVYDASYPELAIRRHLPLAALDKELRAAAKASGVKLLGL